MKDEVTIVDNSYNVDMDECKFIAFMTSKSVEKPLIAIFKVIRFIKED